MPSRGLNVIMTGDPRGLQAALAAASGSLNQFSSRAISTGRKMQSVGRGLTAGLTVPLVAIGGVSAKAAADFESSMSKIIGLVGVSRRQVETWKGEVLDLAKTLPQAPQELADALFFITSAGLRGEDAMKALEASARAAAGGLGETKSVADAVTSVINAYGQESITAAEATDILTGAVKEGKAEAESIAPVIGKVATVAAESGVEFNEVAAALAAMTRGGIDAARASTAIEAILSTFLKPADASEQALRKVGLSAEQMRQMIAERGLFPALEELTSRLKDEGIETAEVFRNKRALIGVLSLTGKNAEANAKIFRSLANAGGLTNKAFEEAARTSKFQLEAAWSSLQVAGIGLGNALLPIIVPMFESMTASILRTGEAFADLPPPMQRTIVVAGLIAAALGPALIVAGKLTVAVGRLAQAFTFLAGSSAARLMLLRGGFVLLGVALITLGGHWDEVTDVASGFLDVTGAVIGGVGAAASAVGNLLSPLGRLAETLARSEAAAVLVRGAIGGLLAFGLVRLLVPLGAFVATWGRALVTLARAATVIGVVRVALNALTVAMARNPFTAILTGITVGLTAIASALGLFNTEQRETESTAQDVADAMREQRDAMRELRNFALELSDARLREKESALAVEEAERTLRQTRRQSGRGSLEARRAELGLRRARIEHKRAAREAGDAERDLGRRTSDAASAAGRAEAQARSHVRTLRGQVRETREQIREMRNLGATEEQLLPLRQRLVRQVADLEAAQGDLNRAQRRGNNIFGETLRQLAKGTNRTAGMRSALRSTIREIRTMSRSTAGLGKTTRNTGKLVGDVTNKVLKRLGAKTLKFVLPRFQEVLPEGFAEGGRVPGFGMVDSQMVAVRGGERILTPEQQFPIADAAMRFTFGTGLDEMLYATGGIGFQRGGRYPGVSGDTDFTPLLGRRLSSMSRGTGRSIFVQSGGRTISEQAALYRRYGPGRAAAPSPTAPHVLGIAADITPGREAFGGVAGRHGLVFRIPHEPWHIELGEGGGRGAAPGTGQVPVIPRIVIGGSRGPLRTIAQGASDEMRDAANRRLRRLGPTGAPGGGGSPTANMKLGRSMMLGRWGPGQWPALRELWTRESGWDEGAQNPSSRAYGIPQALPPSKLPRAGQPPRTGPTAARAQIGWGLGYIGGRYGSPSGALGFHNVHNWYRRGGRVAGFARGGRRKGRRGKKSKPKGLGPLSFQELMDQLAAQLAEAELTPGAADDLAVLAKQSRLVEKEIRKQERELAKITRQGKRRGLTKQERRRAEREFRERTRGRKLSDRQEQRIRERIEQRIRRERQRRLREERREAISNIASLKGEFTSLTSSIGDLRSSTDAGTDSAAELADAIRENAAEAKALRETLAEHNNIAKAELATGLVEARRLLADVISGELGGRGWRRGLTAGQGSVVRY